MVNENLIEKAAQWSLDLSSDSSNFVSADLAAALLQEHQFPLELDSEDQVQWNKIQEQSEGVVDFITRVSKLRHANSLLAANRYYPLLKLYEKHPSNIRFTLLLAECYYLMEDTFGGLLLFKQALELLQESGVDNDPVLEQTIAHIQVLVQFEIEEADTDQDDFSEDGELDIISYTRPPNWDRSSTPSNLVSLQIKWAELQLQGDGAQQFVRLACVTTNELEGVFNLTGDSAKKLARCGLYANSIEGISKRSRTKDPDKVITILKNTEKCINMLNPVIEGKAEFSEQLLKQMHRQLLEDDNIDALKVGDYYCFVVTSMGRFRKTGCHAEHPEKGYVTVFVLQVGWKRRSSGFLIKYVLFLPIKTLIRFELALLSSLHSCEYIHLQMVTADLDEWFHPFLFSKLTFLPSLCRSRQSPPTLMLCKSLILPVTLTFLRASFKMRAFVPFRHFLSTHLVILPHRFAGLVLSEQFCKIGPRSKLTGLAKILVHL